MQVTRNDEKNRYEATENGEVLGFADFRPVGNAVMLPHTEVSPQHEGQGVGSALAEFALNDVKAQGKQVVPMCPFIASYIREHPQYTELVHPEQRGVFKL